MKKSSLVSILKQLSKRDWRAFRKFVKSPYYNQRTDVVLLFDYLDRAIHFLQPIDMNREKVFSKVYSEEFDEKKLRHTTSHLLKILKKYLIQIEFENDDFQTQQYLFKSFRHLRNENKNFQSTADHLTISFVASMLRLGCEIQSHQTMSKEVYDLKLLPQILDLIAAGEFKDIPVVNLYFHCYNSIENLKNNTITKSETHFQEFKKLIHQHWKLIPPNEIRNIYLYAINYCIKRLNSVFRRV